MAYGDRKKVTTAADSLGAEGFWIAERGEDVIPREGGTGPVMDISVTCDGMFMRKGGYRKPNPQGRDRGNDRGNQGGSGKVDIGRGSKFKATMD